MTKKGGTRGPKSNARWGGRDTLRNTLSSAPDITVVVPALREAENLGPLTERLAAALSGRAWELVIVDDDSGDGTEALCEELAKAHPVRLVVRRPPRDGLGGAVLEGFRHARGQTLVVMDADLQHPPEKVPELADALSRGDFALGSRYTAGGAIDGRWSPFRAANSRVATLLAVPFAPGITDPMSGFFALSRSTLDRAERLTPLGYKIALELMCKCRVAPSQGGAGVVEVPIRFAQRERGTSKLSLREQFRYLEHLSRLYDFTFPRASPVTKFVIATGVAWLSALPTFLLVSGSPLARTAWAYPIAVAATAIFHYRYVSAQREFLVRPHPWRDFWMISLGEFAAALLAGWYVTTRVEGPTLPEAFLIPFLLATAARYALRKELLHDIRGLRRDPRAFV